MFSVIMLRVYGNFFQTLNYKTNQSDVKKTGFWGCLYVDLFQMENTVCTIVECKQNYKISFPLGNLYSPETFS